MALSSTIFDIFDLKNTVTLKFRSGATQGHCKTASCKNKSCKTKLTQHCKN